jgi:hypothetical protein
VRNNEIFLFSQPRPIGTLHEPNGWSPGDIAAKFDAAFKDKLTALDRSGDVFNWDPR